MSQGLKRKNIQNKVNTKLIEGKFDFLLQKRNSCTRKAIFCLRILIEKYIEQEIRMVVSSFIPKFDKVCCKQKAHSSH